MEISLKNLCGWYWDLTWHWLPMTAWFIARIKQHDCQLGGFVQSPPFHFWLWSQDMIWNLPFHPQCEWLLKSMISCGVTIWMKHLWWHFHSALFIFQREIWKCCWLIFLILVTIETNPVIKFKYFKTGNSGPWKHFKLFDLKRNYIMYMLWFNVILDLYIYI